MDVHELREACKSKSSSEIYDEYFISGKVWIFEKIYGDRWFNEYDRFKKYIAQKLNVHYNNISIAGSAKLGYSLNPAKNFKAFDENSDVDIIIVSEKLFSEFWQEYINDSYNPTTKVDNVKYVSYCVFRKFLTLDYFRQNAYYERWKKLTNGFEKDIQLMFRIENEIHYRIFESWDSVKAYYTSSIEKIKLCEE